MSVASLDRTSSALHTVAMTPAAVPSTRGPSGPIDPLTPVLVGVGIVDQHTDDPVAAREPMHLMIDATRAAGLDSGAPDLLSSLDRILVPVGRWQYPSPGATIGAAVGSPAAHTVSAVPGVSQQTILSDAATAIARGDITNALVVGGEAGHRLLRARIEGVELPDDATFANPDRPPDQVLTPEQEILPAHERERGLGVMPVSYYALIDSALRHQRSQSMASRRSEIGRRYARYSEIAAANPWAWDDDALDADTISAARMMAFPYTKHHVSNWNVDQASALLLTSVGEAENRGIDRSRWVFPQAFSEANDAVPVSQRGAMGRCIGAELAAPAVLDAAGCTVEDLDLIELYTCFPVAVDTFAEALALPDDRDTSFTGAMPFAGGPFNNFVLHSTAQLAAHLRNGRGQRGLVSTVSGLLTKQGLAVWGTDPNQHGYQFVDVTDATRQANDQREGAPDHVGEVAVVATTVVHTKAGPEHGVVVGELDDGRRTVACTQDPAVMAALADTDPAAPDWIGRTVSVDRADLMLP